VAFLPRAKCGAVLGGRPTRGLIEQAVKRSQAVEADVEGDMRHGHVGTAQHQLGFLDLDSCYDSNGLKWTHLGKDGS